MQKINLFIQKNIFKITMIFLLLQPIIDVITSICINVFSLNITIGMIVRIIWLFFELYYLIFISKNRFRMISISYLLFVLIYFILFGFNNFNDLTSEFSSLIRAYYFPISLLFFINMFFNAKNTFDTNYLSKILIIYLLLIAVPNILNIGFDTYHDEKNGMIGLFFSANEIGGIVAILTPFLILYISKLKSIIIKVLLIALLLYVIFNVGTKVPVLSFIITLLLFFIFLFFKVKNKVKKFYMVVLSLIVIISGVIIFPRTTVYKNLIVHMSYSKVNCVSDLLDFKKIDFLIFSSRFKLKNNLNDIYINSDISDKFLGIGYYSNGNLRRTSELDGFDIFYFQGILGFVTYFSLYIYIIINSVLLFFKNKNKYNYRSYIVSLILIVSVSAFSGHIITAPAVSIFATIIISYLYFKLVNENIKTLH